jgi:hypothetical protein
MDLETLEEIRQLKYRYLRCVDEKLWDELADVLTPDATIDYGTRVYGKPLTFAGRDELIAFFRANLGPGIVTVHAAGQPEITVDGAAAAGTWRFQDTVIAAEHRVVIVGSAFYQDRYQRCADGQWRISHTGYTRTYEAMMSLDDLPSLRFIAGPAPLLAATAKAATGTAKAATGTAKAATGTASKPGAGDGASGADPAVR